jgi:probable F420-dependent oxidoreductase
MDFGVVLQTDPPASRVVELAVEAERLGFSHGWTFDSHILWQEPFVIYSRMLAATETLIVGPMVTNPGTRDWTVLASLFATLNDMYDGRTICGMGRGDSALRYIGAQPTTLEVMVESIAVIKGLVAGEEVTYNGKPLRIPWVTRGWDLPVWVAGYGPKALDTIGRHADGFILQLADPQVLEWTIAAVRAAASDEGRDPASVAICVVAPAYVGDDIAHQRDQLRWFGGMVGNHVADIVKRYGADDSKVPRVLSDYIAAREGYDYDHHGRAGNPSTEFVPDEIVDRFCVLGTIGDHIDKLELLRDLGVDHFGIYLMHDDREGTLRAYGQAIIPELTRV